MFLLSLGEKPFLAISRFRGRLFLGSWPLPPSSNLLQSVLSPFSDLCFHLLFLMLILLPPFLKGMWLQCMSLDNQGTLPVSRSWTQSHVQNFWPCKAIYAQVLRTGSWTSLVGGGLVGPPYHPLPVNQNVQEEPGICIFWRSTGISKVMRSLKLIALNN